MIQSLDLTSIKEGIVKGGAFVAEGVKYFAATVGSLAGRVVAIVKSGAESLLPYLQNPYCAGLALFAFSVTNLLIANKVGEILEEVWSVKTEAQAKLKAVVKVLLCCVVWG